MLRVLHVAQPVDAGVARCVTDDVLAQRAAGLDARVACPPSGPLNDWLRDAPRVPWEATRSPGPSVPAETRRLARIVREVDPGVVHLHSSKAGLAGRLAVRGRRATVFQPHAWSFSAVTGPVRTASLAWERYGARWADVVVCVSAAECAEGEAAGIRARRWEVVPNGVDLTAYAPSSRAEARARLGLGDGPLVVCVGRLSRQKGQDVLVEAMRDVDADLVLVGDGPEPPPPADRVTLVGRRDDVADWYAAADVVAVPSRWEGMALTALEALACDRPVVATDVAGMREALGDEPLVPVEDAAALAQAITRRLRDPGSGWRERAERFDLRRTTAAITALYGSLRA